MQDNVKYHFKIEYFNMCKFSIRICLLLILCGGIGVYVYNTVSLSWDCPNQVSAFGTLMSGIATSLAALFAFIEYISIIEIK